MEKKAISGDSDCKGRAAGNDSAVLEALKKVLSVKAVKNPVEFSIRDIENAMGDSYHINRKELSFKIMEVLHRLLKPHALPSPGDMRGSLASEVRQIKEKGKDEKYYFRLN